MVCVSRLTTDLATAWRIRDELANHPLLGGASAGIEIVGHHDRVLLTGWALDKELIALATRMAGNAAGRRVVQAQLCARYSAVA